MCIPEVTVKGSMFGVFESFVCETYGHDVYEQVLEGTTLETTEPFVGPGTYPPGDLLAMVGTAAELLGVEPDAAVRAFGRYAFAHLARSVPHAMDATDHPLDFLEHLESLIHTEVRKLDGEAKPPRILLQRIDDRHALLRYESALRLLPLVSGLLDGVGDWFGQTIEHELVGSDGDVATYRLTFATTCELDRGIDDVGAPVTAAGATAGDLG